MQNSAIARFGSVSKTYGCTDQQRWQQDVHEVHDSANRHDRSRGGCRLSHWRQLASFDGADFRHRDFNWASMHRLHGYVRVFIYGLLNYRYIYLTFYARCRYPSNFELVCDALLRGDGNVIAGFDKLPRRNLLLQFSRREVADLNGTAAADIQGQEHCHRDFQAGVFAEHSICLLLAEGFKAVGRHVRSTEQPFRKT